MIPAGRRLVAYGLTIGFVLSQVVSAQNDLRSLSNAQFEVVGLHARSVSYVDELSQHLVTIAERYFEPASLQFPQRILVCLRPAEFADFEGDYQLSIGERGFVSLDVKWQESLSLLSMCTALSEALMVRYSIFNYGAKGPSCLPDWPVSALAVKAYLTLRPAQSKQIQEWIDPAAIDSPVALLQRKWQSPLADLKGYLLLHSMELAGMRRQVIGGLMEQGVAGVVITPALVARFAPASPAEEAMPIEAWWQQSMFRILSAREDPMESMEVSRRWIEGLSDLSEYDATELNLAKLWDARDDDAVRALIEARYEILRLRILQVNPAYFNAARSLGALFETYLSEDSKRHRYMHGLVGFLGDFEDSKELEEAVTAALTQAGTKSAGE